MSDNKKEMSLYDCSALFAESMHEKFPNGCEGTAIFLVATDGKKVSSLVEGSDILISQMIAHLAHTDGELKDLITESIDDVNKYEAEHNRENLN